MTTLVLIHGGLWEEGMDAERFWHRPGIVAGLRRDGFEVLAPKRLDRAPGWIAEASHLAPALPDRPVTILAGSNGCSVAVRLAVEFPARIERLVLAWPATANDPVIDAQANARLAELNAPPDVIDALLTGQTLRGSTDAELATLDMPVAVVPSMPENPAHQRHTVDALLDILPRATELPGCPEPPHPGFAAHAGAFLSTITGLAAR
jgi:pimeloyl-ACP methyl ester carboxylesterase